MKAFTRLLLSIGLAALVVACGGGSGSGGSGDSPGYTETVLHSFGAGTDGANPSARLLLAADGNFYGTTVNGGASAVGTIFQMSSAGVVQAFYSFSGGSTGGANPEEALTQGNAGNFYGTTRNGGTYDKGIVFKITPAGVKTVLHEFGSGSDGANPIAAVVQASDGYFYGTTFYGGNNDKGTLFKVSADGTGYSVIHHFGSGDDGANPAAGLVVGSDGKLYGTTYYGGGVTNYGTVFRASTTGLETVLHAFTGGAGGAYVDVGLVEGSDGNFYGVTAGGGEGGVGTVFKLTPAGDTTGTYAFDVIYAFAGGEDGARPGDGASPSSRLIQAQDGDFYGTTFIGGANEVGTVYRISTAGTVTVVYSFGASPTDAVYPDSALVQRLDGFLYGTTEYGGDLGLGTVYRLGF